MRRENVEVVVIREFGALLVLAVPIIAWLVVHKRAAPSDRASDPTSTQRHRWWQP